MPTMTATATTPLTSAIADTLARIPPLWPLRHFVAVNPFVGLVDRPFGDACALLARTTGAAPLQSPADYLAAWRVGQISPADLTAAADADWTTERLVAEISSAASPGASSALPTVADWLDRTRPRAHWSVFITEEISKWCGAMFDDNQATWRAPWRDAGLYAGWRDAATHDRNPEAFGLRGFREFVATLPTDSALAIEHCLELLRRPGMDTADFFHRQLATISGWAGYAQYLVREDSLRGKTNPTLRDLLAIRLAYDAALWRAFGTDSALREEWAQPPVVTVSGPALAALVRWQLAYELGYQRQLAHKLAAQPSATRADRPTVQAIFCIDVRSEIFRRHLEAALPGAQTIGFAGFFGFPVAHQRATDATSAPTGARCPVLLVPPVGSCEPLPPETAAAVRRTGSEAGAWKAFQNSAASTFSFVESCGLAFGPALARITRRSERHCTRVAPSLTPDTPLDTRIALAEGALRNMGLVRNFARLVLVNGHGSQSANNPYASALDCGACGGHAGDVNARLAAATLNDPAVRAGLATRGLPVHADTWFLASLHNTATDDIALYDLDAAPVSHTADIETLRAALARASADTRRERASRLGESADSPTELAAALDERATDISQVRPEWALANNAALIAAPRSRTAALRLDGRVFLHDYDHTGDPEDKVLTLILCAPVVVASWINLQYYASRVDPVRYGSGNKVLHNVIAGVGVAEGNGGDLQVGLPLQSIHDGEKFVHEPRRLCVYLEAPCARISGVLAAQPGVRQLFDHGWIHLVALEGNRAYRYTPTEWIAA